MRGEAAGQGTVAGVLIIDVAYKLVAANFVRNPDEKIGWPMFQDFGVVHRSLKFANHARGGLFDDAPRPIEHETMDGIAVGVAWLECVFASIERVLGSAD